MSIIEKIIVSILMACIIYLLVIGWMNSEAFLF